MFFLRKAAIARINSNLYNQTVIRKELKSIIRSIDTISKKGYDGLTWRGEIDDTNLKILIKLGYKITKASCCRYEIKW